MCMHRMHKVAVGVTTCKKHAHFAHVYAQDASSEWFVDHDGKEKLHVSISLSTPRGLPTGGEFQPSCPNMGRLRLGLEGPIF